MTIQRGNDNQFTSASWDAMNSWFEGDLGRHLLSAERALVEPMLNRRFGYHLLQLGCADLLLHDNSPVGHKFSFRTWPAQAHCHTAIARGEAIPLRNDSVDLVLLHHALDFSAQQHQLLREAARVLIAGGHLVCIGFNPRSVWGMRGRVQRWTGKQSVPWQAAMLGPRRLTDWLALLDFQVEQLRYGVYSLPVDAARVIRYSGVLEGLAGRLNWPTGAVYAISARKQVLPLTPVQSAWRRLPVPGLGIALPEKATCNGNNIHKRDGDDAV